MRNFLCLKHIPVKRGNVLTLKISHCVDFIYVSLKSSIARQSLNEIEFIFKFFVILIFDIFLNKSTATATFSNELQPVMFINHS